MENPSGADGDGNENGVLHPRISTHTLLELDSVTPDYEIVLKTTEESTPKVALGSQSVDEVEHLSNFEVVKLLGDGGSGRVYLARNKITGSYRAIKVLDKQMLSMTNKLARAYSEKEILASVDHPFIVTLYASFQCPSYIYHVMELCPGGDMYHLLSRQPGRRISETLARFYAAEITLALEYLHLNGFIYRDLKPENVLLAANGHIRLADFDLSRKSDQKPQPKVVQKMRHWFSLKPQPASKSMGIDSRPRVRFTSFVGTQGYVSPEIVRGEGHTEAVDWWSLGVLVYEMLYGRLPFSGATARDHVLRGKVSFPFSPRVSNAGRDFIRRLLLPDVSKRLGSASGASEVMDHPFFEDVRWALIRNSPPPEDVVGPIDPDILPAAGYPGGVTSTSSSPCVYPRTSLTPSPPASSPPPIGSPSLSTPPALTAHPLGRKSSSPPADPGDLGSLLSVSPGPSTEVATLSCPPSRGSLPTPDRRRASHTPSDAQPAAATSPKRPTVSRGLPVPEPPLPSTLSTTTSTSTATSPDREGGRWGSVRDGFEYKRDRPPLSPSPSSARSSLSRDARPGQPMPAGGTTLSAAAPYEMVTSMSVTDRLAEALAKLPTTASPRSSAELATSPSIHTDVHLLGNHQVVDSVRRQDLSLVYSGYHDPGASKASVDPLTDRSRDLLTHRGDLDPLTYRGAFDPLCMNREQHYPRTGVDPLTDRGGHDPLTYRGDADPLTYRGSTDPLTSRGGADPFSSRVGTDPLTNRGGVDPLTSRGDDVWNDRDGVFSTSRPHALSFSSDGVHEDLGVGVKSKSGSVHLEALHAGGRKDAYGPLRMFPPSTAAPTYTYALSTSARSSFSAATSASNQSNGPTPPPEPASLPTGASASMPFGVGGFAEAVSKLLSPKQSPRSSLSVPSATPNAKRGNFA
eukprot:Rmarinus@m.4207